MFLAIKEMKKDKGRFLLIIGIVILISYLVFFLTGLAYGLAKDNTSAVEEWEADAIVLKSGTNGNLSSSMMDVSVLDDFDQYDISPLNLARSVAYKNGDEAEASTIDLVLVGMDQESKAYPEVIEGNLPENADQVLASQSLKEEYELEIGDMLVLSMNDREYEIVGFTAEAKYNVSPVIYTDLQQASATNMSLLQSLEDDDLDPEVAEQVEEEFAGGGEESTEASNETSEGEAAGESTDGPPEGAPEGEMPEGAPEAEMPEGVDPDATSAATFEVPERIAGILVHGEKQPETDDNYDVIGIDTFISELPGYTAQVLTFGLMIGFLILIATIVLGVFMYIITMQKKQTFGIMKVQGISNKYIAKSVLIQTVLVSTIGSLTGLLLTVASEFVLPSSVPFRSNYVFYAIIAGLFAVTSLIGALFSVRGVTKVDPLEVLD